METWNWSSFMCSQAWVLFDGKLLLLPWKLIHRQTIKVWLLAQIRLLFHHLGVLLKLSAQHILVEWALASLAGNLWFYRLLDWGWIIFLLFSSEKQILCMLQRAVGDILMQKDIKWIMIFAKRDQTGFLLKLNLSSTQRILCTQIQGFGVLLRNVVGFWPSSIEKICVADTNRKVKTKLLQCWKCPCYCTGWIPFLTFSRFLNWISVWACKLILSVQKSSIGLCTRAIVFPFADVRTPLLVNKEASNT